MNYKALVSSRKVRLIILKLLDIIPDKIMIYVQYLVSQNRFLNLDQPVRFTEKVQWYKLYYRHPLITKCSDKYKVREFIKDNGLEDILIPLYGVYDSPEDIDFSILPKAFIIKTNNGSHTNIICENKEDFEVDKAKLILGKWLNDWKSKLGREWGYYNIKPKIIVEKYLVDPLSVGLIDYKFFCFNGCVKYLYVVVDRLSEDGPQLGMFDTDFARLNVRRNDIDDLTINFSKPANYDRMVNIAQQLSKDFPHVRVDLYNIDGKIYFGELTFYNGSGYKGYMPDSFDITAGNYFNLPDKYGSDI